MSWNYRVLRRREGDDTYVYLHEVYYDKDGNMNAITENPVGFMGDSVDDLIGALEMAIKDAKERPVLDEADIPDGWLET